MGIVEATFLGLVLLAILVSLGALAVAVLHGALESTVPAKQAKAARAVTWHVVTVDGAVCLVRGRECIVLRGATAQVLS